MLPSAIGWLQLEKLNLQGNGELRIPDIVLQWAGAVGVQAVLTYLQIVCEQYRLIENHLDKFSQLPDHQPADFLRSGALLPAVCYNRDKASRPAVCAAARPCLANHS